MWDEYPVVAGYFKSFDDPDFGLIRFEPEFADFLDFNERLEAITVPWQQEATVES